MKSDCMELLPQSDCTCFRDNPTFHNAKWVPKLAANCIYKNGCRANVGYKVAPTSVQVKSNWNLDTRTAAIDVAALVERAAAKEDAVVSRIHSAVSF